ncbi:hypothetical protein C8J56DRAFT_1061397 [Mycena floridula]|nr:hypothetical protein C8J56DRAFT_1061397 [Mycena floridula]
MDAIGFSNFQHEARAQISEADAEIKRLEVAIGYLNRYKGWVGLLVAKHEADSTPITRMPLEILSSIFENVVRDNLLERDIVALNYSRDAATMTRPAKASLAPLNIGGFDEKYEYGDDTDFGALDWLPAAPS